MDQQILQCDDGGIYFCTQRTGIGESGDVVWFGTKGARISRLTWRTESPTFANVFWGRFEDGQLYEQFQGEWWDVPYGNAEGHGTMSCRVSSQGGFTRGTYTGGFGGSRWSPAERGAYRGVSLWSKNPYPSLSRGGYFALLDKPGLTGVWTTELDGMYFVRQVDDTVVWFGTHDRRTFANVFKGTISGDRLTGAWIDIPFGASSTVGRLTLELHGGDRPFAMRRVPTGSNYGENRWLKIKG